MTQHRVTAVITTYHREWKMILRAIHSVLNQTIPVYELLLVDDNGPESPFRQEIEREAAKISQIRYLPMPENGGVAAARNLAIQEARGEILGYLDDDDEWCPDKLEKLLPLFEQEENVALVFGTGRVFKHDSGLEYYNWQWEVYQPAPSYSDMLYTDYVGSASAPLIKTAVLRELGGFRIEDQPAAEDYELWIRIAQRYALRGIQDVVFLKHDETSEHVSGSLCRVGLGFRNIYRIHQKDYEKYPRAKTAMLWNICRTGVRGLDVTVVPYVFAWLWSRRKNGTGKGERQNGNNKTDKK